MTKKKVAKKDVPATKKPAVKTKPFKPSKKAAAKKEVLVVDTMTLPKNGKFFVRAIERPGKKGKPAKKAAVKTAKKTVKKTAKKSKRR